MDRFEKYAKIEFENHGFSKKIDTNRATLASFDK